MERSITVADTPALEHLETTYERAKDYMAHAKAPNTLRAYRSDWSAFQAWCEGHGLQALPADPKTVALYVTALADVGRRASTIQRALVAIGQAHRLAGYDSPARDPIVATVWQGVRRALGTAQRGKAPLLTADVRAMAERLPDTLLGRRDRALILLGFAGAFRRSELVGLDVEDLDFTGTGLVVTLRRSKTDQEGRGRRVGIPYGSRPETCPVRAVQGWMAAARIASGPLFRPVTRAGRVLNARLSDKAVALVVKRATAQAGLDPSRYAGHSLRAGHATSAAAAGAEERIIMQQTGHRSVAMLRRYIREGSLFRENSAAALGL